MYCTSIRLPQRCTQRDNRNSSVFELTKKKEEIDPEIDLSSTYIFVEKIILQPA